jgi:putative DNA primase/helicase
MRNSAETIALALGGRKIGKNWLAKCPAHDDQNPSLSITIGRTGTVLVHCFAGCDQQNVISELKKRNLWTGRNYVANRR